MKLISLLLAYFLLNSCSKQRIETEFDYSMDKEHILTELMFDQLKSEGCKIQPVFADGDSLVFQNEIRELPKLIFFHTELNCNVCVEQSLISLHRFSIETGKKNIIFLASYSSKRNLYIFKRINQIESEIYNVSSIGLSVEELNMPFCCVLSKENIAECVFVPLKEDSLLLARYLDMVKEKYFTPPNTN